MTTTPRSGTGSRAAYSVDLRGERGVATVVLAPPGREVVRISFWLGRGPEGWALEIAAPRVHPAAHADRLDLALVAALMSRFSAGRRLYVTVLAEEPGWQAHRLSRREQAVAPLVRRWQQLGFEPRLDACSCQPAVVARTTYGFQVPDDLSLSLREAVESRTIHDAGSPPRPEPGRASTPVRHQGLEPRTR